MPRKAPRFTAANSAGYAAPAAIAADPVIFTVERAFDPRARDLGVGTGEERPQGALHVLLVSRDEDPAAGSLQLPGGFVGEPESPEETAARKLEEKTGVRARYLEQLRTYADPGRDSRGWIPSVAFLALIPWDDLGTAAADSHGARWVPVDGLERENLAFDHREIIADGLERLRGKLWYSNIAMGLLPELFTTGEARRVYEAVLGHELDPGNFARDLRASGLVADSGKAKKTATKPGKAYRFVSRKPEWSPTREKGGRAR